ncbi:MAG: UDP-3-O-(3-hydroxymyristoyl)glucosamine N-acyltransferase [Nitrospirota bacterium]
MTITELAAKLGAELRGPGDAEIRGVAGIREAREGDVTYLSDQKHQKDLAACRASAVIVSKDIQAVSIPALVVKNPRYAFALALGILYGKPYLPGGISERAVIGKDVVLGAEPTIHPFAVVANGAKIGSRVTLYPGVYVGEGSVIGDDALLYPNVSIREGVSLGCRVIIHAGTVIGSDGFGFVTDGGRHHKIPQVGGVIIEDDVEIGANCTIDRAALGNTVIRKGTKLDNLVHVAHNVTIGEHCLLTGQVGIAGSTSLGSYVVIGGQSAISDHLTIGDRVMIGGGSGVSRSVEPGQVIAGYPAVPLREWLKAQVVLSKLPELKKLVAQLQERIDTLEKERSKQS